MKDKNTKKTKKTDGGAKRPAPDPVAEERGALMRQIWGRRKVTRLNKLVDAQYCGPLTVREFLAIVLVDGINFPRGIDTPLAIGDFEGNFSTNVLSITVAGAMSDHVCVTGDPHDYIR